MTENITEASGATHALLLSKLRSMPVKSYIAYPAPGQLPALIKELRSIPGCEVRRAINQDLLVLITTTPDEKHEEKLNEKLKTIKSLHNLTLVVAITGDE
jgi:nitrate reductase NapAB chaperone NapD